MPSEQWIDAENEDLTDRLIGRTIVGYEREPDSGEPWGHGENSVTLTLDDGSKLEFTGTGYDASALITVYLPPQR